VREGWARFVPVELGIAGEEHFEVTSGLEGGETVVAGPFRVLRELKDGEKVRAKESSTRKRGRGEASAPGAADPDTAAAGGDE
jgi:HlyD family secretion protein